MHVGIIHTGSRNQKTSIAISICGNQKQQFSLIIYSSCSTTSHKPYHHEYTIINCVQCCKFLLLCHPSSFASYVYVHYSFVIHLHVCHSAGTILNILIISFQCYKFLLLFHPSSFASYMYMFIIVSSFIFMFIILSGTILSMR